MNINYEKYIKDYGNEQVELPINELAIINNNYRASIWTGTKLQLTVMSIKPNEDIGVEMHDDVDQLIFIVKGCAKVYTGDSDKNLQYKEEVSAGDLVCIPLKTWHNIVNCDNKPLKLYSVYAPVNHPYGTKQKNKGDAEG